MSSAGGLRKKFGRAYSFVKTTLVGGLVFVAPLAVFVWLRLEGGATC